MNDLFIPQLKLNSTKTTAIITYSSFPENYPYVAAARIQNSQDAKAFIQLLAQRSSQQGAAP